MEPIPGLLDKFVAATFQSHLDGELTFEVAQAVCPISPLFAHRRGPLPDRARRDLQWLRRRFLSRPTLWYPGGES